MTFQEFFEKDYKYRSYDQKISNARYDYNRLVRTVGSSETIELICVAAGASGAVNDERYKIMIDLTNDRASKGSFACLVQNMYTPYTLGRVCKMFHKDKDTIYSAIAIVLLFASTKGYLSSDDNKMIDIIYNG